MPYHYRPGRQSLKALAKQVMSKNTKHENSIPDHDLEWLMFAAQILSRKTAPQLECIFIVLSYFVLY